MRDLRFEVDAYERQAKKDGFSFVIGADEVGRGPLAGPVVVAAVYLKEKRFKHRIDDSKKLSPLQRQRAFLEITEKALFGLGVLDAEAIDSLKIVAAVGHAVDLAVERLLVAMRGLRPDRANTFCLFDGGLRTTLGYPSKEIIAGDGKSLSIACASIVAKVIRDRMMVLYSQVYPRYGFDRHKGYGTRTHLSNIARYGMCPIHRRSFCSRVATSASFQTARLEGAVLDPVV